MKTVTALKIRQAFGEILKHLQNSDEPFIIEKGRKPVAVLISIEMFNERFVDFRDAEKRAALLDEFKNNAAKADESSLAVLRESRYG